MSCLSISDNGNSLLAAGYSCTLNFPWRVCHELSGLPSDQKFASGGPTQAGVAMEELAGVMRKPFRPLWISQTSTIWMDEVPPLEDLEYTPLILISASLPDARQRRSTGVPVLSSYFLTQTAFLMPFSPKIPPPFSRDIPGMFHYFQWFSGVGPPPPRGPTR